MTSPVHLGHGLAMLQAASVVLSEPSPSTPSFNSSPTRLMDQQHKQTTTEQRQHQSKPSCTSVSALLNPSPADTTVALPPGFVLGKDGKLMKKRGRKPTPGLTDEDRRQARLLKNRRTAETSRRRKLALMNRLTAERDHAKSVADQLRKHNEYLRKRLAQALGRSLDELLETEPDIELRDLQEGMQSFVSVSLTADCSESDGTAKKS